MNWLYFRGNMESVNKRFLPIYNRPLSPKQRDRSGKKLKKSVELGERVEVLEPGGGKDRFSSLDKSFTPV